MQFPGSESTHPDRHDQFFSQLHARLTEDLARGTSPVITGLEIPTGTCLNGV
jgi:hypothetical protein